MSNYRFIENDFINRYKIEAPVVWTTTDKNRNLDINPHYSDHRFSSGQMHTIFGKHKKDSDYGMHKDLTYVYSDRLWQWDYNKAQESYAKAKELVKETNCLFFEAMMSHYQGYPVIIEHIIVGVNVSNGYSYQCFGFKKKE